MRVVLSWSGESSHEVAKLFETWLPTVVHGIEPWISSSDISSGSFWFPSLKSALDTAQAAIVFVTPQNVRSEWMHFEAGAIAAKVDLTFVCPYLLGVKPRELGHGPFSQLQCCIADESGTKKMIRDIYRAFGTGSIPEQFIDGNFIAHWPQLRDGLQSIELESDEVERWAEEMILQRPESREKKVSNDAATLLLSAGRSNGRIHASSHLSGFAVTSGQEVLFDGDSYREKARWIAAIRELTSAGLAEDLGGKGEVFGLTNEGYRVTDIIAKSK